MRRRALHHHHRDRYASLLIAPQRPVVKSSQNRGPILHRRLLALRCSHRRQTKRTSLPPHAMQSPLFLPPPVLAPRPRRRFRPASVTSPTCRTRVPNDATTAASHIQDCVRVALISGHRRLCVDVLTAAVDVRARTFDSAAAAVVTRALILALLPVLPAQAPELQVVVNGPAAALRVRTWLAEERVEHVSVAVLGVQEEPRAEEKDPNAFVVLDPPAKGDAILELRRLLQRAQKARLPVIVHNHPREDALYSMLGYGGHIPFELTKFEPAFVLAPFALAPKRLEELKGPQQLPPRFVVLRKYPDDWALWRFVGPDANEERPRETDPVEMEQLDEYVLCEEFQERPTDNQLVQAVHRALG